MILLACVGGVFEYIEKLVLVNHDFRLVLSSCFVLRFLTDEPDGQELPWAAASGESSTYEAGEES